MINNIIVSVVGIILGLIIALIGFQYFIGDIRLLYAYLYDDAVVFRSGNGDILFWQSEFVEPLDNPEEILSVHRIRIGEDGFRLPEKPSEQYDVVVLGDSYTEGANVARPWSDIFASDSDLATRNLGVRGYGITHYTWVWQEYGIEENPNVVILGFFGGNDVLSAGLDNEPPFEPPNSAREEVFELEIITEHTDLGEDLRIYPIYLPNGEPIALMGTYVSWMNAAEDQLRGSENYRVIEANLQSIIDSASDDTCLVFAYFPSKPEVYLPYINDEDYPRILNRQKIVLINSDGTLHIVEDETINFERSLAWRLNTGNVFTELATSLGYKTINLQTTFDQHAADGEMLYYTYDTHWNQAGQTLAGETIADFVETNCDSISS